MSFVDTRYDRQEKIPVLGPSGQQKLAASSVAVIGAGGVKSPLLYYLAGAGVGRLRIIDFDSVELSNLNRQILYDMDDIGTPKAAAAARRLKRLNPDIAIEAIVAHVDDDNFDDLLGGFSLVIEGGNSAAERIAFNRAAIARSLTYIHASAQYNYAYVFSVVPGLTACFECVFPDLPQSHGGPVPVIGCATGIAGSIAASEAVNILVGRGPRIVDRALFFDGWLNSFADLPLARRDDCPACGSKHLASRPPDVARAGTAVP